MTDHGQQFVREEFLRYSRDTQQLWEREPASPGGPLPRAVLDVPEHRDGGAGHMRPGTGSPAGDIDRAAAAAEDAWVDMEHFPRRPARPETGYTESAPCPEPGVPGGITEKARLSCGSPSPDVAEAPEVAEAIGPRRSGGSSGGRD
ncbi:hypothetical protein AB0E67_25405 [Streptomyces sp. NPDC032161]|uniref:hypothetical protein n=1 Tax=unclassified Streptomyces TaxID=2593676 RepID=UPI0033E5148C